MKVSSAQSCPVNRALTVPVFGAPDVLRVVSSSELPTPRSGEVRVRVEATSLCFTDTLIRRNLYPVLKLTPPVILGYDFIGRIDAIGPDVAQWRLGDRVADLVQIGGAQDYLIRRSGGLVRVPESVSAIEAEPLVLSYLTAYQALIRHGRASAGSKALVLGASGAVGLAALDLCRALSLRATGVASTRREALIASHGAAFIGYDGADFKGALGDLAARCAGFDLIVDVAGDLSYSQLRRWSAPKGIIVAAGFSGIRADGKSELALKLNIGRKVVGAILKAKTGRKGAFAFYDISATRKAHPDWFVEDLSALFNLLAERRIAPLVSGVYGLEDAAEGHARLDAREVTGRLVIDVSRGSGAQSSASKL